MKTFRKSSLISSVALLLVAIVALSGATFAWFSANNKAKANGISVTSSAASGLLISVDNGTTWGSNVNFDVSEKALIPTSTSDFTNWYTALSDNAANYAANADGYTADGVKDTHYFEYTLLAKTADGGKANLTISAVDLLDDSGYGRFAIVRGSDVMVYYMDSDTDTVFPIMKDTDTKGKVATAYPKATPDKDAVVDVSLGEITGEATSFKIYVWNEGQDSDCKSIEASKTLTTNFELTATPTT